MNDLDCVARSMERATAIALHDLGRRVRGFDAVARTAPLLGMLATATSLIRTLIMLEGPCADGGCAGGFPEAIAPFILSLPIAVFACGAFFYFSRRLTNFELDLRTDIPEVLNDLARMRGQATQPLR